MREPDVENSEIGFAKFRKSDSFVYGAGDAANLVAAHNQGFFKQIGNNQLVFRYKNFEHWTTSTGKTEPPRL